jgi:hypothetical protein
VLFRSSFKLADEVLKRTAALGATQAPPFGLMTRKTTTVAVVTPPKETKVDPSGEDLSVAAPERKKPVLQPKDRVLDKPVNVVDPDENPTEPVPEPPPTVKPSVPTWVWVVAGGVAVAGAGVGAYFGIREATRPVTGTVTASW